MGRFFDFEQVKPWSTGGFGALGQGLSDIGDIRNENEKRRLLAEKQAADIENEKAKTAAYTAQVAATNASAGHKQIQDDVTFNQGQQDRREKIVGDIAGSAYASPDEAAAKAAASQFPDPRHPGQTAGITFNKVPLGPEPQAPERPVAPAPDYTPDIGSPQAFRSQVMAKALGTQPAPQGSATDLLAQAKGAEAQGTAERLNKERGQHQDEQLQYDINKPAFDMQSKDFGPKVAAWNQEKAHPKYELGFPGGQKTVIDPSQRENAKGERAKAMAEGLLDAAKLEPDGLRAGRMRLQASEILLQIPKEDKASINSMDSQSKAQDFKGAEQKNQIASNEKIAGDRNTTGLAIARLHGHGKGKGGGGDLPTPEEARVLKEVDSGLTETTRKGGLEEQVQHMDSTLRQLKQQPQNPDLWTNAIDAAVRTNTGRAAIKAQYDLYRAHSGGATAKFDDWLEGLKSGNPGGESGSNLMASFDSALGELRAATKSEYDKMDKYRQDPRYLNHPAIKLGVDARMRNAFGADPGQRAPAPAAGPATPAQPHPDAVAHFKEQPVGTVKPGPDGKPMRKIGPGQWEAVPQ